MTLLLIIGTVSLIALNAFFVAGEYALVRARRARLEKLKEEGDKRAELALEQLEEIGAYISTSQVGITLSSIPPPRAGGAPCDDPIPAVVTVDISQTVEEALKKGVTTGYTRLLVTENFNPNRLRGMVHTNALARP